MIISNNWSLSFVVAAFVASAGLKADFRFSLEPLQIQPGQSAVLTLQLSESDLLRPEGTTEEELFPEADDALFMKTPSLELLDQSYRKENGTYVWRYRVTGYEVGALSLAPITVTMGPQTFSSERVTLTIAEPEGYAPQQLSPNADAVSVPWDILFWAKCLGALLLGVGIFLYLRKKPLLRLPSLPEKKAPVPTPEPPVDWLRRELLKLRVRTEAHPHDDGLSDQWSLLLREYLEKCGWGPSKAWTENQLKKRLNGTERIEGLLPLFADCNRERFAPKGKADHSATHSPSTLAWIEKTERLLL
jgi:hypothetical protein